MTIMICDDDKTLQKLLRQKIEKFCADRNRFCRIVCCDSGEEMLALPAPDVLFLDIQMSGKNGMEIARELRRRHENTILIFVTAMSEYVYEAFDVDALHYLIKPFSDEKLQEVLNKALQQLQNLAEIKEAQRKSEKPLENQEDSKILLVKRGGLSTKVFLSDIIYAEVFNRKVMLHTLDGDIEYYGKLTDLSEQAGAEIYRTHRAYLVNLKYVEKYNATTVWLEQGTALLSKKQFSGFVQQYMQYINRQRKK
ncbi:MAG: LytTR family DNA-binding domain-containing protein [Lachnospiraceae bacterium]|nr:LytTR family DNA-binding domain-containing protein [Lachnospiraceae bacterium]